MMKEIKFRKEDMFDSARTILRFIKEYDEKKEENELIRKAIFEDLYGKTKNANEIKKSLLLAPGLMSILPENIREMFEDVKIEASNLVFLSDKLKEHKNIGIITVLKKELEGVFLALGLPKDASPNKDSEVFRYWFSEIERSDQEILSVVTTIVGEPRNVPTAIAVEHLLNHFTIDLMIFVGIAAGPPEKVKLGDVVISERVYDYEHVRSEKKENETIERPRPLVAELNKKIRNDFSTYDESFMLSLFDKLKREINIEDLPKKDLKAIKPNLHRGTSIAGERLFADGRMSEMRKTVDERIRACDQEDSGFVQACKFRQIDWCIFRGISDFGDSSKNEKWHTLASLAAASAAITFLKHSYRLPDKAEF